MNYEEAKKKLDEAGQSHVLKYWDSLNDNEKESLLAQIESTDFAVIERSYKAHKENVKDNRVISPIQAMKLPEIEENRESFYKTGLDAIKNGKVGAVLLAGGMGTRLGANGPKGVYDIGVTHPIYIFERIVSNLMDVTSAADTPIHLFIMTSDKNHETTVSFFNEHNFFGYDSNYVHFFKQDMAVATDTEGKVYMDSKFHIADSPNGNGGWFISMINAGLLDIIDKDGIEYLNVFAVDNVLQRIADPLFIGAMLERGVSCGAKVVKKSAPDEKVGVMCLKDKAPSVVEYYELTEELMNTLDESGERAYNYGVILNYTFKTDILKEISSANLPWHVVEKKIPYINEDGNLISPETPNGYKYETLILDMVEMFDSCIPFEVVRNREFAPIKNKTGVDSIESARELLKENGVEL